jgi:hypothetical protein
MVELRICVFANMFIDNEERLSRMKDSFESFKNINPYEWRINVRGNLKYKAGNFLKMAIGSQFSLSHIESKKGWLHDSTQILAGIQSDYVFFWVEDHICLVDPAILKKVFIEMHSLRADQCLYSFLHKNHTEIFQLTPPVRCGEFIDIWTINNEFALNVQRALGRDFYVTSAVTFLNVKFLFKILKSSRPFIRRWPIHLPFDFEKKFNDGAFSEIRYALPKVELFACIDDDHGVDGYSLISRGLYPNNISRSDLKMIEYKPNLVIKKLVSALPIMKTEPLKIAVQSFANFSKRIKYSLDFFIKSRF